MTGYSNFKYIYASRSQVKCLKSDLYKVQTLRIGELRIGEPGSRPCLFDNNLQVSSFTCVSIKYLVLFHVSPLAIVLKERFHFVLCQSCHIYNFEKLVC